MGAALEQVVDARRGATRVSLPRPTRGSGRSSRAQQIVDVSAGELVVGERVMLIDAKDRRYLITLREGAAFHTHAGIIQHDDLIGTVEGSLVRGSTERSFLVLRPTLSDVVLKMPRGAQVIYPKDLGTILMQADIGPGMRVLEAGVGSGALSMTLLRAGAHITGYEIREDFAQQATANVHDMLGTDVRSPVNRASSARPVGRAVGSRSSSSLHISSRSFGMPRASRDGRGAFLICFSRITFAAAPSNGNRPVRH